MGTLYLIEQVHFQQPAFCEYTGRVVLNLRILLRGFSSPSVLYSQQSNNSIGDGGGVMRGDNCTTMQGSVHYYNKTKRIRVCQLQVP